MPSELYLLLPLGFAAGVINATVGGGGLVMVPGLFTIFPHMAAGFLMGTDKLTAVMGHAMASRQYACQVDLPWRLVLLVAVVAFVSSYVGVHLMSLLPIRWMRLLVIILVVVMLLYTWLKPEFGSKDTSSPPTQREMGAGVAVGGVIGFYDGFFGPGTGSFLIFLFVRVFRFDFLRASGCAKVVNFATNLGALAFLLPNGLVMYAMAIPMGVACILGSVVGSKVALRGGNLWIRRLFLVLSLALLARLSQQVVASWL